MLKQTAANENSFSFILFLTFSKQCILLTERNFISTGGSHNEVRARQGQHETRRLVDCSQESRESHTSAAEAAAASHAGERQL